MSRSRAYNSFLSGTTIPLSEQDRIALHGSLIVRVGQLASRFWAFTATRIRSVSVAPRFFVGIALDLFFAPLFHDFFSKTLAGCCPGDLKAFAFGKQTRVFPLCL